MSNIVRSTQKAIVKSEGSSTAVGGGLVALGALPLGVYFAAGFIPFISFPVLCLILMVVGGGIFLFKD